MSCLSCTIIPYCMIFFFSLVGLGLGLGLGLGIRYRTLDGHEGFAMKVGMNVMYYMQACARTYYNQRCKLVYHPEKSASMIEYMQESFH